MDIGELRRWALGLALVACLLLAHVATVSGALHALICDEAGSPGHQCLVGLVAQGLLEVAATAVTPAPAPDIPFGSGLPAPAVGPFAPPFPHPPGRAPPVAVS